LGTIAGGTSEGVVNVYNPAAFKEPPPSPAEGGDAESAATTTPPANAEESAETPVHRHKGAALALDFCSSQPHMLASAGADGEVAVIDLTAKHVAHTLRSAAAAAAAVGMGQTPVSSMDGFECVAWNKSVASVIAGASSTGTITIWDLRKKSPAILSFTDSGRRVRWRGMAWDPSEATVLAACCDEDERPVVLWDLRSVQMPRHFAGHRCGVWSLSWSQLDSSLIVTSGKDKTLCWNPATLEIRREISVAGQAVPATMADDASVAASAVLAAAVTGAVPAAVERWDAMAAWSPRLPGALALCSFGSQRPRVSLLRLHDPSIPAPAPPAAALPPPPQWMRRPVGAAFGFGGRIAFFRRPAPVAKGAKPVHRIAITRLAADEALAARAERFKKIAEEDKLGEFCLAQAEAATASDADRAMWTLLDAHIRAGQNIRQCILKQLGFDRERIAAELASQAAATAEKGVGVATAAAAEEEEAAATKLAPPPTLAGDEALMRAVAVGDFEHAVEYCVAVGRHADALAIASLGGNELFTRTRDAYMAREWDSREWLRLLAALSGGGANKLVETIDPRHWRVALAAVCAYAKDTSVATLASMLGDRLRKAGDDASALLCYIVAGNTAEVTAMWLREAAASTLPKNEALATLVEKLTVLKHAVAAGEDGLPEEGLAKFVEYDVLLASQGNAALAVHYLGFLADPRYQNTPGAVLLDRLAHSGAVVGEGMKRTTSPFRPISVGGSLAPAAATAAAAAAVAASASAHATAVPTATVVSPPHSAAARPHAAATLAAPYLGAVPQPIARPGVAIPAPRPVVPVQAAAPMPIPAPAFVPPAPSAATAAAAAAQRQIASPPARVQQPVVPMAQVRPPAVPAAALQAPPRMFVPPSPAMQHPIPAPAGTVAGAAPSGAPMHMAMAGTQAVLPTAPRPKPEALTTSLAATVVHEQPADPADVDAVRAHLAAVLPEIERHAAGTASEPHVAEMKAKLEVLAPMLARLPKPAVASVAGLCRALSGKDWATADVVLAAITKDHSKELTTQVVIGLRFLVRLSKMLLK